ncbi:MAG: thioredoxin fold domain-containing protein, partial [Ekhidna sp.]|nr:thioredoxin fold domain-containing protein [Ekhidna sp.]
MRQVLYSILLVNWLIASASSIKFQNIPLDRALSEAKTTGKFVFIDFYTDWCRPCKVMEQQVFKDDSIALLFEQEFISIRINAEKEQQTLVTALGIKAYPTLVFYDPKGRLVFRKEGAMKPRDFQDLSESLISINQQLINYQKNDRKVENVFPYLQSLKWIDERKASKLARKYLHEVKEKDYDDPLIWGLISEFVTPLDRVLFTRVANAENLREKSPESLEILHLKSFDILLEKAMKSGNSAFMRRREQYIKKYGSFLSNKDSVALIGRVQYNSLHDVEKYSEVLESYVEKYLPEEAMHYALISYELSQNYFQESILEFASTLARKSISMEPNLFAYLALSGIQEKLSNYKSAYAFLLLAYEYADEDRQTALNQQEKELKHKMESELA